VASRIEDVPARGATARVESDSGGAGKLYAFSVIFVDSIDGIEYTNIPVDTFDDCTDGRDRVRLLSEFADNYGLAWFDSAQ
jgi:hypothetical protein